MVKLICALPVTLLSVSLLISFTHLSKFDCIAIAILIFMALIGTLFWIENCLINCILLFKAEDIKADLVKYTVNIQGSNNKE